MKLLDGRSEAFQWDSNIYAVLKNIKEGEEVHFAHKKDINSLRGVVQIKEENLVAKIPNILLQRAGFIQIYWFLQDKNGNRTIKREELKVLAKEKPEDYEYEGDDFLSYKTLDEKITNTNKRIDATNEKISETKLEILGESGYNKTVKDSYELAESKPSKAEVKTEIDSAINDFSTKISDDGTINTFKELIDYAAAHKGEYSTLSGEVQKNSEKIGELDEVSKSLEESSHTHSNKAILDSITAENIENSNKNVFYTDVFYVDDDKKITTEATAEEIREAYKAGKEVIARVFYPTLYPPSNLHLHLLYIQNTGSDGEILFQTAFVKGFSPIPLELHYDGSKWNFYEKDKLITQTTLEDYAVPQDWGKELTGKVFLVNSDGYASVGTIPQAEIVNGLGYTPASTTQLSTLEKKITEIKVVDSLPENPDLSILYLIKEGGK